MISPSHRLLSRCHVLQPFVSFVRGSKRVLLQPKFVIVPTMEKINLYSAGNSSSFSGDKFGASTSGHATYAVVNAKRRWGKFIRAERADFGKLVYRGPHTQAVKLVKSFSLSTSALATCCAPILWLKRAGALDPLTTASIGLFTMLSGLIFLTPICLHLLTRRYVVELYYNSDTREFTAVLLHLLLFETGLRFHASAILPQESAFSTVSVGNRSLLIDQLLFEDKEAELEFCKAAPVRTY